MDKSIKSKPSPVASKALELPKMGRSRSKSLSECVKVLQRTESFPSDHLEVHALELSAERGVSILTLGKARAANESC